ncbi:MAG TPA: hypothetical protein VJN96_07415 [Vicinamibacterales bacterium]|nr:hypothetical protein [Vicinamibacterales bacterium]
MSPRRLTAAVLVAVSLPGAALAQSRAPTPPAPPAATFISQSLWTAGFSSLASGDPHFAHIARVTADIDVVDYVNGRLNFYGVYEGVLGTERRRLDLNHENFVVEASATRRVRSSEFGVAFHHVSRHLTDRDFEGVTAWNEATFRAAHVLTAKGTKYWGHVDFGKVLQHSNVDYSWITRVELDLDRPLNQTTRFVAMGNATLAQIRDPATRLHQFGARGEGGIVFGGRKGGMEIYGAFEHRIDAYPLSHARVHWWEIGFRLIGSS